MGDQPKENEGMSKAMAKEAVTLHDLYERVQRVCMGALVPRIRYDWNPHGAKRVKSWRSTNDFRLDDAEAEAIILAACVRWLVDKHCIPMFQKDEKRGLYECSVFYEEYLEHRSWHQSLTIAALLAVEAVCEERRK